MNPNDFGDLEALPASHILHLVSETSYYQLYQLTQDFV